MDMYIYTVHLKFKWDVIWHVTSKYAALVLAKVPFWWSHLAGQNSNLAEPRTSRVVSPGASLSPRPLPWNSAVQCWSTWRIENRNRSFRRCSSNNKNIQKQSYRWSLRTWDFSTMNPRVGHGMSWSTPLKPGDTWQVSRWRFRFAGGFRFHVAILAFLLAQAAIYPLVTGLGSKAKVSRWRFWDQQL